MATRNGIGRLLPLAMAVIAACRAAPPPATSRTSSDQPGTTSGAIAVGNFEAEIEALDHEARRGNAAPVDRGRLVDLLLARAHYLGRVSDYDRALDLAEGLVREEPSQGSWYLARAVARAAVHRFPDAMADLDRAAERGAAGDRLASARAAILQATGRYEEALATRRRLAGAEPNILTLGALASALAEGGELEEADRHFVEAPRHYRNVSPFAVAWIYFHRGSMWMRAGQLRRARPLLENAVSRLPQYAAAATHLAEVEAALGRPGRATELLRAAAGSSEDPDTAAQLARILGETGQGPEAGMWRERAAARYEELLRRHPAAFADHAAEFWLAAGADPRRALDLARMNLQARNTPRAHELVMKAALAASDVQAACAAAQGAAAFGRAADVLRPSLEQTLRACAPRVQGVTAITP